VRSGRLALLQEALQLRLPLLRLLDLLREASPVRAMRELLVQRVQ